MDACRDRGSQFDSDVRTVCSHPSEDAAQFWAQHEFERESTSPRNRFYLPQTIEVRMVGERGFEPPTPWSRTRCSTRLSHSPTRLQTKTSGGRLSLLAFCIITSAIRTSE